jgi:hypothetical protein
MINSTYNHIITATEHFVKYKGSEKSRITAKNKNVASVKKKANKMAKFFVPYVSFLDIYICPNRYRIILWGQ